MFKKAVPVWINNRECEMNVQAMFRANILTSEITELHIAGTAFYRVYANGVFLAAGPARAALGYVREDVIPLPAGTEEIMIEAVGYYCKSISTVHQPSFIMAEIRSENDILAYTGQDFEGLSPQSKIQKVERYSVQRHFTEIWDYTKEAQNAVVTPVDVNPIVLDRRAPYPVYNDVELPMATICGTLEYDESRPYKSLRYSWATVPKEWGIFDWEEISYHPHTWIQRQKQHITSRNVTLPMTLGKGEYAIFDFQQIEAGFIKATIESMEESDVVLAFTEFYEGDEFIFQNMNVHNVVEYFLKANEIKETQSFEPYTYRFVLLAVKEGKIRLNALGVKTYELDTSHVRIPKMEDAQLDAVYRAAMRNYAHNEVDLYMDCPSRERAGWIGDSFFTAKGEYALTGETRTEDAFLENYRLFENHGEYIEGAIPECYPADAPQNGTFIPQFTMLYILEVYEYLCERGHLNDKDKFRKQIYDLLEFYRKYENADGLLENLPSWNFVEWGPANDWTKDVSYPTNFLYSKVLQAIGKLYEDAECMKRSNKVREVAIEQSFNGTYFMDHAIRNEKGNLILQKEASEVGQYYAVLFGDLDIHSQKYSGLKHLILQVFSPERNGKMPEILEFNMIMGAYMRMEVLAQMKEYDLLLHDIKCMFGQNVKNTGTLWEYRIQKGSYDHGICVYVAAAIQKALKR